MYLDVEMRSELDGAEESKKKLPELAFFIV